MKKAPSPRQPLVVPMGIDGVLATLADQLSDSVTARIQTLYRTLAQSPLPGQVEVAPSLGSVLVRFDRDKTDRQAITRFLQQRLDQLDQHDLPTDPAQRLWRIPVAFGGASGPQLAEAAALADCTESAAVSALTSDPFRVLAIGFAPGQPYIGLLPENWNLPRQSALTPLVPAGALVVAVRQLVLFGNASPTGWRHIGQSAFACFRPESRQPFPLQPGDMVQFEQADATTIAGLRDHPNGLGGAVLSVKP